MVFSEVFYTGLYTSAIGLIIAVSAQCYKSKCKEVSCCCIKILRDVEAEEELDIQQPRNPINTEPRRSSVDASVNVL
jgi:hypothetical protein